MNLFHTPGWWVWLLVQNRTVDALVRMIFDRGPAPHGVGVVVVVWSSPRPVSTGQLHTLRCFHFRPINPLVWAGALPH